MNIWKWLPQKLFSHINLIKKYFFANFRLNLVVIIILLPIHFALAIISGTFTFQNGITPIWPSTGVFLAALLLCGRRIWFGIWFCDFVVFHTLFLHHILASLIVGFLDSTDPLVAGFLIKHFIQKRNPFNRVPDVILFVALLIPYPIMSSAIGTVVQCWAGITAWDAYKIVWRTWYTSNISGMLIIAPVLLVWLQPLKIHDTYHLIFNNFRPKILNFSANNLIEYWQSHLLKISEFILIIIILLFIGNITFLRGHPLEYMMVFPLIWSALRLGQKSSTLLILIMAAIAVFGTSHGFGSFAKGNEVNHSLVLLQSFVGTLAIATLILSSAVQENRTATLQLQQMNEELEQRVEERTYELQQAQAHLIQQEKMSSLGQLVAGVSHEINNPVNFIHGNLNHIQNYTRDLLDFIKLYQHYYPEPVTEIQNKSKEIDIDFLQTDIIKIINSMNVGTERIHSIVQSLRNFSRMDEAELKQVDIHEGIDSTLVILQHRLQASPYFPEMQIIKNYGQLPKIECYPSHLNQVFMNILTNAIDALEELSTITDDLEEKAPTITIRTSMINAEWAEIAIADNGPGMSEEIQKNIFNPFFTTKPVGKGTGMGISISYQIITQKHTGQLKCFSTLGKGTEFVIQIPISNQNYT
ncbi:MASE1 domain-containing protein [Nostoc sp. FACHB-110]|uniref:MASE1 domain-containing protein n=1 Tax=Nostoc sp. FACHB-110 TaxID=2692834 RepID=UPI001688A35B|nr:MASE1 domain-containing protein [Nostoc sp. FACHB-110]MBD2439115.1 MASE1 domain-containing protein [Nostoc sp. FACHB-110]